MTIFNELYEASTDTFWKSVFDDFQSGDIPFDITITDTSISSGEHVFDYADKEVSDILEGVKGLLRDTVLGARANSEPYDFSSWKKVKKKSTRQAILLDYLIEYGSHLPYKEVLAIYKLILTAITFKLITHEDIHMNANTCKIDRIKGVELQSKNPINIQMGDVSVPPLKSATGVDYLFK